MVLDYDQINNVIINISEKFNLDTSIESIDKLIQKVENNNYYCTVECKELHVLTPTVKNGFFFNPGHSNDLANKIEQFIKLDDSCKKQMSQYARKTAEKYKSDIVSISLFNILFKHISK